jgi:hypothetical protein
VKSNSHRYICFIEFSLVSRNVFWLEVTISVKVKGEVEFMSGSVGKQLC